MPLQVSTNLFTRDRRPSDPLRAQALVTALGVRAALDAEFGARLEEVWQQARSESGSEVRNTISGGTRNGPVLQGRDFSDLTFHMTRSTSSTPDGD